MFPRSKLVRLSKEDKLKRPSHWIKSASTSVLCLDVTNLLTGSKEGVNELPSLLYGCNMKINKDIVDELVADVQKIPKKCLHGDVIRGPQLNMGFSNFAGKNRNLLISKELKQSILKTSSGFDVNIPTLLRCHSNKFVSKVFDSVLPILVVIDNCFKKALPQCHLLQMKATHNEFKLDGTCFNKVMLKISPKRRDRGCKIHYDRYNYGYCAILILLPSCTNKTAGGEQVIICNNNVYKMKCDHGDLFFGQYQHILHCVTKCTSGTRCAIVAYTSNKIVNYCKMKDVYDNIFNKV